MKKILYVLTLFLFVFSACEKDEEIGGTAVQSVAGEWWVQVDGFGDDYYKIMTYNTSDNSSTVMWLDDAESFYQMKGKVNVDLSTQTFSGDSIQNEYYDIKFSVKNGKIMEDAATASGTGYKTDSISFDVQFSDDPGVTYTFAGYRRTGFNEDDH